MESTMFLEINDLKKSFGQGDSRVQVLRGIDLSVDKGEICVLLGPSGSGKSTLLNIIGGIDAPDSGYVSINGEKMVDMTEKRLTRYRREHLGYVFQMYNLIPNLNIKENIEVGAYLSDHPLEEESGMDVVSYTVKHSLNYYMRSAYRGNVNALQEDFRGSQPQSVIVSADAKAVQRMTEKLPSQN